MNALEWSNLSMPTRLRNLSLAAWMLIAILAGVALGYLAPETARRAEIISTIFLRLIKSIIAPVMFGVLVTAVTGAGSLRDIGRLGWKSVLYFESVTSIALLIGWFTVAIFQPGKGVALPAQAAAARTDVPSFATVVERAFPTSIFDAMARGDVLEIVVFCLLLGLACHSVGAKARPVVAFAESVSAVAFKYTSFVMYLAPFAVCSAMAATVASGGGESLKALAKFVVAAWVAQIVYAVFVLGGSLLAAGASIGRFTSHARKPFLVAFATASSAAALPQTLECLDNLGIPKRIAGIVAPLSMTLNMSGSCIHLAMSALFAVQAAGLDLRWTEQAMILLTLKLTSKGVVGIPRANFVILAGLFGIFSLPLAVLPMLLGIDAVVDVIRTGVNVLGHCVAGPVIARWEGAGLNASPAGSSTSDKPHMPLPAITPQR